MKNRREIEKGMCKVEVKQGGIKEEGRKQQREERKVSFFLFKRGMGRERAQKVQQCTKNIGVTH